MRAFYRSVIVLDLLTLPARAVPQPYLGTSAINNFNVEVIDVGQRPPDPFVYSDMTVGTSYLPGGATEPSREWADDIHTVFSSHPFNMDGPGNGADFIMSGFRVDWFINGTSGVVGSTLTATVRFYQNGPSDTSVGALLAAYNFVDPNTTPGIRNTNVRVDDIVMPADLWMSVEFAFDDGATPSTRRPGVLIANSADWPENPFPAHNPPTGGAEVGHSDWWFLDDNGALRYFAAVAMAPPGNLLMSVYGRAVPEPATLGLLAVSGLALLRRRR